MINRGRMAVEGDLAQNQRSKFKLGDEAQQDFYSYGAGEQGDEQEDIVEEEAGARTQAFDDSERQQLTLVYQAHSYCFDEVTPDKVKMVLSILGGQNVMSGLEAAAGASHAPSTARSNKEHPPRLSEPERAESIRRYREKKSRRNFDKKITYGVRHEVAKRMNRKKGQFASSKTAKEQLLDSSDESNANCVCYHCGSQSTPQMRKGPQGPKTLCNKCGLKWANKGVLPDINQVKAEAAV